MAIRSVFNDEVPLDKLNCHWWELREEYQGLKAPVPRKETEDFDPGSMFHVANNLEFLRLNK